MINFDDVAKENIKKHNQNWPQILDHPHRILIVEGSASGKINALLDLISHKLYTDKNYLDAKDPYEAKYQSLTKKHRGVGLKENNDSRAFIG